MTLEWSYAGDLPPRIDMVNRAMLRRGSTLTLTGMFGLRTPLIDLRTGATLSASMSVISRTITEVKARTLRTSPPVGFCRLNARSSTFLGNQVQIRITYAADWNESGTITVADIFAFLTDWFAATGDYNESGTTTVSDVFAFLADWFAAI